MRRFLLPAFGIAVAAVTILAAGCGFSGESSGQREAAEEQNLFLTYEDDERLFTADSSLIQIDNSEPLGTGGSLSAPAIGRYVSPAEVKAEIIAGKGQLTMLHIYGSWCLPCQFEFPGLIKIAKKYTPLGLKVVAVAIDDTDTGLAGLYENQWPPFETLRLNFANQEQFMRFTLALSGTGAAYDGHVPYTVIYGRNGRKAIDWYGIKSERYYEQVIQSLL